MPRSKGNHLSENEVVLIIKAFAENRHPRDVANELECSIRSIQRYYHNLRGG
jgi:hypothetical protein